MFPVYIKKRLFLFAMIQVPQPVKRFGRYIFKLNKIIICLFNFSRNPAVVPIMQLIIVARNNAVMGISRGNSDAVHISGNPQIQTNPLLQTISEHVAVKSRRIGVSSNYFTRIFIKNFGLCGWFFENRQRRSFNCSVYFGFC
jgi:hypothetical protein